MTNSRQKGAAFERDVAKILHAELGIRFKRDLDQYRQRDRGDLIPDDDGFPFLVECKAHATGTDARGDWIAQVFRAVEGTGKHPALIWKFNHHPIRVRVWFDAIAEAVGGHAVSSQHADITLPGLCWLAREIMARRAE